jgi:hypothetical protein
VGRLGGGTTGEAERVRTRAGTNASDGEVWYMVAETRPGSACPVRSSVTSIPPQSSVNWYPTDQPPQERQAVICASASDCLSSNTAVLCIAASPMYMSIETRHTSMFNWCGVRWLGPRFLYFVPRFQFAFLKFCISLLLRPLIGASQR